MGSLKTKSRRREKTKIVKESSMETARKDDYILSEHHDIFCSGSLDKSFEGAIAPGNGTIDLSSSQIGGRFEFEDNFLGTSDGFDLAGGLGDELARELGWEINERQALVE